MADLVDEPLAESAPLALRLAPTLCRRDPATGESCAWNHGLWQFLRLLGLALTPANHAGFYRSAMEAVTARGSAPRILISAAADYSMLAHVLAAMRNLQCDPDVTVIDLCETPLMLNRWYAERSGLHIRTCRADILDYRDDKPFDLICTDSFLGRFTSEQRRELMARWRDLLHPGGALITLNRVREAGAAPSRFTPEQAEIFRKIVLAGAESLRTTMQFDLAALGGLVDEYTKRPSGHSVCTHEGFLDLFLQAGFAVERVTWGDPENGLRTDVSGPRIPRRGEFGRIIALRR
jgi:hypothetical protein